MDPELRRILQRIAETTEENNELLRKLHRSMVVGRILKLSYWLIILAVAVGAFYFIQPYLEAMGNIIGVDFNEPKGFLEFFRNFR